MISFVNKIRAYSLIEILTRRDYIAASVSETLVWNLIVDAL